MQNRKNSRNITTPKKTLKANDKRDSVVNGKNKQDVAHSNSDLFQFKERIKINLHPRIISFLIFIFPLVVSFVALMLYLMQDRWSGYLPTISETGTEYPNNDFFAISMGIGSFSTGFGLFVRAIYIHQCVTNSKFIIITLYILASISSIGIVGLGFF